MLDYYIFFVILGIISTQLEHNFSKTGILRRSVIARLNLSAKTAPGYVFLEYCLMFFFIYDILENTVVKIFAAVCFN